LIPGSHPAFDRALFLDELPPVDLRWLAPVFEKISETVREEQRKRRKGEAFAERFKWRLVSSALLSVEGLATGTSVAGFSSSRNPMVINGVEEEPYSVVNHTCEFPGNLDILDDLEEDSYYDAQSMLPSPIEELVELPPVPILSTVLLILLRFPHIILLLVVLCIPFWSSYLIEGRLWVLLLKSDECENAESVNAEADYEEVDCFLSGLN
jgi:hypothetical protein